jgi:hypothetical protein
MSEEVLQKLEEMEERLDRIEKTVKGGDQPSTHLKVEKNGGPGCKEVALIMKKTREGGKFNGVKTGEAMSILEELGHERTDEAVRRLLKRIAEEFPSYKIKDRNGEAFHLQYHP